MMWRKYSAVAKPGMFAVKSFSRMSGRTFSFYSRLRFVRCSSQAKP
mgnify:CR=1 FL=1